LCPLPTHAAGPPATRAGPAARCLKL
jgi:hypothetical protein